MSNLLSLGCPLLVEDSMVNNTDPTAFGTGNVIDAASEKFAVVGCVWHPTIKTGTINIRKIHFRLGAVTFNAASVLQVSLQNISDSAGPPYQPDGVADQTATMTSLTANAWNTTGNLSADRAVDLSADSFTDANSRWLSVVFEYTTFTAADSIVINTWRSNGSSGTGRHQLGGGCLLNTGSWALNSSSDQPIIAFECSDGSYAFMLGGHAISSIPSAVAVGSAAAVRRAGMKFKFPVSMKISRLALFVQPPNGCDGRLVLYDSDGSTELVSVSVDNDAVANNNAYAEISFIPITIAANTFYRFVWVGDTSTTVNFRPLAFNAVGFLDCYPLGQNAHFTTYDGSSWSDVTTQRCPFRIGIESLHDGYGQTQMGRHRRR